MKYVAQCTKHDYDSKYITKIGGGGSGWVLGQDWERAEKFDTPESAVTAAQSGSFASKHDFVLIPVEVIPPTPGEVRRLI